MLKNEALAAEVRDATAPYLETDAKDTLAAIRATLDPEEQTLLVLRLDRGLSWSEIASVLEGEQDGGLAASIAQDCVQAPRMPGA